MSGWTRTCLRRSPKCAMPRSRPIFAGTQRGFTPATVYARDVERVEQLPNLTLTLIKRGFSDEDILKILGENHQRLFQQTWT